MRYQYQKELRTLIKLWKKETIFERYILWFSTLIIFLVPIGMEGSQFGKISLESVLFGLFISLSFLFLASNTLFKHSFFFKNYLKRKQLSKLLELKKTLKEDIKLTVKQGTRNDFIEILKIEKKVDLN